MTIYVNDEILSASELINLMLADKITWTTYLVTER